MFYSSQQFYQRRERSSGTQRGYNPAEIKKRRRHQLKKDFNKFFNKFLENKGRWKKETEWT